jgi:inorganic pyrophosphatase
MSEPASGGPPYRPPARVDIVIDAPRFSFVKRDDGGGIDLVSPLPCPFNYGSVPGTRSGDGERIDALLLGRRRARGRVRDVPVVAIVHFIDAGQLDPKWVCSARPLDLAGHTQIDAFFHLYALAKRTLNRVRGKRGETRYDGIELLTPVLPLQLPERPIPGTKRPTLRQ